MARKGRKEGREGYVLLIDSPIHTPKHFKSNRRFGFEAAGGECGAQPGRQPLDRPCQGTSFFLPSPPSFPPSFPPSLQTINNLYLKSIGVHLSPFFLIHFSHNFALPHFPPSLPPSLPPIFVETEGPSGPGLVEEGNQEAPEAPSGRRGTRTLHS